MAGLCSHETTPTIRHNNTQGYRAPQRRSKTSPSPIEQPTERLQPAPHPRAEVRVGGEPDLQVMAEQVCDDLDRTPEASMSDAAVWRVSWSRMRRSLFALTRSSNRSETVSG